MRAVVRSVLVWRGLGCFGTARDRLAALSRECSQRTCDAPAVGLSGTACRPHTDHRHTTLKIDTYRTVHTLSLTLCLSYSNRYVNTHRQMMIDGLMDGGYGVGKVMLRQIDGQTNRWIDRWTDKQTDS